MQSFTEIYERNFEISWNFRKKGINYDWNEDWIHAEKFATFWMFPEQSGKVLSLIRFVNLTLIQSTIS